LILPPTWAGSAQSVWRLATGWTVRGPNAGVGEIFRTRPDWPWGPPSLLYNGYQVFPGVKRPGRDADHSHTSSAEVKEREEPYNYSRSGPSWPVLGRTSLNIYHHYHPHYQQTSTSVHVKSRFQNYSSHIGIPAICPATLFAAGGRFYNPPAFLFIAC